MAELLAKVGWGPWTLGFFLITGLYFSVKTGFFQVFGLKRWLTGVLGDLRPGTGKGLSPLRTLSTALAAAIGTGSIAGVAAAITLGGPGAVFWMEVAALLGMMTGCGEKILSVKIRKRRPDGTWRGGPMVWLKEAGFPGLGGLFALCAIFCSIGMGALVQSNSIAAGLEESFGLPPVVTGLVTAVLAGICLRGGLKSVGSVCEKMVPIMAGVFLISGCVILYHQREALPGAISSIFTCAFSPQAAFGGGVGEAIRCGVARGLFTNEAGLGTTAMIHAASDTDDPLKEGYRGIFEVFLATMMVCTVTSLVILTSAPIGEGLTGAALSTAAFRSVLGPIGPGILSFCLTLFAFSSILGSATYGQLGLEHLGLNKLARWYLPVYLVAVALGSVADVTQVWHWADVSTSLMAWPSLTALWLWRKEILAYFRSD